MMHRLDAEYRKRQSEAPLLEKRPSAYMREFYYDTRLFALGLRPAITP